MPQSQQTQLRGLGFGVVGYICIYTHIYIHIYIYIFIYRENGTENGSYYLGSRGLGLGFRGVRCRG